MAAWTAGEKASLRRSRIPTVFGVEPQKQAVIRIETARPQRFVDPLCGQQLFAVPISPTQHQQADASLIFGVDQNAAAPMGAAGYAFDLPTVDIDAGGAVAGPGPVIGGTDRAHDAFGEDL